MEFVHGKYVYRVGADEIGKLKVAIEHNLRYMGRETIWTSREGLVDRWHRQQLSTTEQLKELLN